VEEAGSVIDEIRHNAPPQIELTEVLIREHKLREAQRIAIQRSMDVQNTGEFRLSSRPWHRPQ
jgi:hypothetical protein